MFNKIYIYSPTHQATGGTELLQQLAFKLRENGKDACMVYTTPYEDSAVKKVFEPRYRNPYVTEIEDDERNLMIVSEAALYLLLKYSKIQKAVWWLSVDFYGGSFRLPADRLHRVFYYLSDLIYSIFDKNWIHLVQSEYAYQYCIEERKIPKDNVYRLSDYLSKAFIENCFSEKTCERDNIVLYNPKKGFAFTQKLINSSPEIKWVPIQNMTSDEIINLMNRSKVYVDFGQHPGKDRIPREAAICGCCIITGMRGAAKNGVDIPIPLKYKFNENNIITIINQINYVISNYDTCKEDYTNYVNKILSEESVFEDEVKYTFIINPHPFEVVKIGKKIARVLLKPVVYAMKFGPTLFGYK